jgi:hypothetical protein
MSTEYHKTVAEWPHAPFLELFGRSGFRRSLKVLRIAEVLITDGFLIATLSSLDSLEHLYRSQKIGKSIVLVVVTPNFLRAITFQTPDYRIPRPRHFVCTKQLQFAKRAFVAFLSLRGSSAHSASRYAPLTATKRARTCPPCYPTSRCTETRSSSTISFRWWSFTACMNLHSYLLASVHSPLYLEYR